MYISSMQSYNAVLGGSTKIDGLLLRDRNQAVTTQWQQRALLTSQIKDVCEHVLTPCMRNLQLRTNMI